MDARELPLNEEVLEEVLTRIKEYTMKRTNEFYYVERYLRALQAYTGFLKSCIRAGEPELSFEEFLKKMPHL